MLEGRALRAATMATVFFDHIQIRGSRAFINLTRVALECLRSTQCGAEIWQLLTIIRKARRSGVQAHQAVPVISVGITVWTSPMIWYASGIAHEAFHIKLYREAKARAGGHEPEITAWAGVAGEKKCLEFQLRVLEELRAEAHFLEYVKDLMKSPDYQGDPLSDKDYWSRDW
jgi:hypothetical protein